MQGGWHKDSRAHTPGNIGQPDTDAEGCEAIASQPVDVEAVASEAAAELPSTPNPFDEQLSLQ